MCAYLAERIFEPDSDADRTPAIILGDAVAVLDEPVAPEPEPRAIDASEAIEQIIETLSSGDAHAIRAALAIVVRAANAIGATCGEWSGRGETRLLAFRGPVAATSDDPAIAQFFADAHRRHGELEPFCVTTVVERDLRYACAAFARRGRELLTFVMWGNAASRFDDLSPTRVFLRLVDRLRTPAASRPRIVAPAPDPDLPAGIVRGSSRAMHETYRQMRVLASADFPILVSGETGVGKEHIVRSIHAWSRRKRGPFVAVNCAAIPDTLLEAEMFGIGRGVASGVQAREGKFRLAEGGTLFLDEIGELPLPLQAKLLRVLQDRQVTPVGGPPVDADVRVIAATNADLEEKMRRGLFRSDLYYRIAGSVVRVPPLRERRGDVAQLIEHFLHTFAAQLDRPIRGLSVRGLELLVRHTWPGNVRELEHEIRRLVYTCAPGQMIDSSLLSGSVTAEPPRASATLDLAERTADLERDLIRQALQRSRGNRSVAARLLGLSRNGLALKMQRLEL